jgi:hypothetical protein
MPSIGEGDAKLLGFFLRDGECTAEISESTVSVWYSWLPRSKPSTYFISLAPGLVCQLMRLGEVQRIADEATFQVGPGTAGRGPYVFDFERKWVRIQREDERIVIKVRDQREDLKDRDPEHFGKIVRCERCNSELGTPLAKQCLHCGFDWH